MADSTSIIMGLTTTTSKKTSKSITNVNPNASDGDIKNFVDGVNSLTSDTLTSITKVSKSDIENVTYYDITIETTFFNNDNGCLSWNNSTKTLTVDKSKIPADSWNISTNPYVNFVFKANNTVINTFEYASTSPAGEFASPISIQPGGNGLSVAAVAEDDTNPITIKILAGRYSTINYNSTTITIQIV